MASTSRREANNARRHRCPASGRTTVKKRVYLPFVDERCGPCITAGRTPRVMTDTGGTADRRPL